MRSPQTPPRQRPPWPDELPRLVTHFGLKEQRPGFLKSWIWCIVVGSEERIVGAVQLLEGDAGSKVSVIHFTIRSAWVEHPATKKAFRAALAKAQELNLTRVQTQTPLGGGIERMLLELEFESDPPREIWQLSIEAGKRTTMGIVDRLHKHYPRVIEPLNQSNLAAVTGLCEKLGLLSASRIAIGQPGQVSSTAFDPRLSFVIMEGEEAAAILLSRAPNLHRSDGTKPTISNRGTSRRRNAPPLVLCCGE